MTNDQFPIPKKKPSAVAGKVSFLFRGLFTGAKAENVNGVTVDQTRSRRVFWVGATIPARDAIKRGYFFLVVFLVVFLDFFFLAMALASPPFSTARV